MSAAKGFDYACGFQGIHLRYNRTGAPRRRYNTCRIEWWWYGPHAAGGPLQHPCREQLAWAPTQQFNASVQLSQATAYQSCRLSARRKLACKHYCALLSDHKLPPTALHSPTATRNPAQRIQTALTAMILPEPLKPCASRVQYLKP